ncbi:hypothetical protein [Novosphingobium malaysiense]|uniref:hypothetical protein n=1 Tax=Novosphingobium malaysiense TaxID=1348853 RepID=UPI0012E06929|nr:hypothetical protein [Novosphingobium malaysiense]
MNFRPISIIGAAVALTAGSAAMAAPAEVVSRDSNGQAAVVRVDGESYAVCDESRHDDCINPRAAGLNWGDRPLDYWPGKPASEMQGS